MTDLILDALREALTSAHRDLESLLYSFCRLDDERVPIRDSLDAEAVPHVSECDARIANLTAAIAAREDEAWQPIETAAKTRNSRLVWCPNRQNTYCVVWSEFDQWWENFGGGGLLYETPTHWRPLPAPPVSP